MEAKPTLVRPTERTLEPEGIENRIYALLRRCANLGQACPSHDEIAERLQIDSRAVVASRTRRLIELGLIRVEWPARSGPRVVTIVATGKTTFCPEAG